MRPEDKEKMKTLIEKEMGTKNLLESMISVYKDFEEEKTDRSTQYITDLRVSLEWVLDQYEHRYEK